MFYSIGKKSPAALFADSSFATGAKRRGSWRLRRRGCPDSGRGVLRDHFSRSVVTISQPPPSALKSAIRLVAASVWLCT